MPENAGQIEAKSGTGQIDAIDKSLFSESAPSGIAELDRILTGGFPTGSTILVAGPSGSGKTIFSFQWLFSGIRNNENCLYLTITESVPKLLKNLEKMEFFDMGAIVKEKLKIIDLRDYYGEKSSDYEILDFIRDQLERRKIKRLCIDSITALAYNLDEKAGIRKFIFDVGQVVSKLGCTVLLTSEVSDRKKLSAYSVEEFISDAIVRLDMVSVKGEVQRTMNIVKVRGKGHSSEDLYFKISEKGLVVFPKLKPALDYSASSERVSTGNAVLDKMLLGGVFRASSTLIIGSAGTGKSLTSMQFTQDGLQKGEQCLYVSFEESRQQVFRNASALGWDFEGFEKKGLLHIICAYPNEKFLNEHLGDIMAVVEGKMVSRATIDSVSAVLHSYREDTVVAFIKGLNNFLKKNGITTFFTWASSNILSGGASDTALVSTLVDNIVALRYVEINGELQLVLNVIKIRGSGHSKGLAKYQITDKGIVIGGSLAGYEGILTGVTRKVSTSTEEKLESEFKAYLGPVGIAAFQDLRATGLKEEVIIAYIDGLKKRGILDENDAEAFKADVKGILG